MKYALKMVDVVLCNFLVLLYRRFSGYDGLDLCCFEVANAPHKNIIDNNIEAVEPDHCDPELQ